MSGFRRHARTLVSAIGNVIWSRGFGAHWLCVSRRESATDTGDGGRIRSGSQPDDEYGVRVIRVTKPWPQILLDSGQGV